MSPPASWYSAGRSSTRHRQPIGSFLLAECADRAELDAMIANDPYTKGNVWQRVEVKPVRLVVQDGKITP